MPKADIETADIETKIPADHRKSESLSLLQLLSVTSLGERRESGVSVASASPQGYILAGPLPAVAAGDYELTCRCQAGAPRLPDLPVLGLEVVALGHGQLVWRDFCAGELSGEATIRFRVPSGLAGGGTSFNVRLFHFANADLTVTAVGLRQVVRCEPDETRFRLLGRMVTRKIARHRSDGGVAVSRWRKPGCFLSGPLSFTLPRRNFRLTIGARVGPTRPASRPVLGVEVFGGKVQQAYRDFTAEELVRGPVTIDFTVGLGTRVGETPAYRFDLYHFGNADLEVDKIELAPVEETNIDNVWRLSGRLRQRMLSSGAARLLARFGWRLPLQRAVRPRLRIAAGRYRLCFDVMRASPAAALDVELAVIRDWRPPKSLRWLSDKLRWRLRSRFGVAASHRVTEEEWRAGRVTYDFDVSPDWSYDGEHVWLDPTFLDTGSKARVDNVEITRLSPDRNDRPAGPLRIDGRKNLLIFGNCQAEVLSDVLRTELSDRFSTAYQYVEVRDFERYKHNLERADILLVQDVADWEKYPMRDLVSASAQVIRFPCLRFASLWPFDHCNGPGDPDASQRDPEMFPYLDGLLARLRKETPDPDQRFGRYAELQAKLIANPMRIHQFEARRLLAMDRNFQCGIGSYIIENFQHRRLFHTTSHPVAEVFVLLIDQILKILEIRKKLHEPGKLANHHFGTMQVPIHPKVANMLGATWVDEKIRYRFHDREVTWEEYIRLYIRHFG